MRFKYDVFVSYAGEDKAFARQLVDWLDDIDELEVWYAPEEIAAGRDVQRKIAADVPLTRHSIFIVSSHWLEKRWTRWERDLVFADHAQTRQESQEAEGTPVRRFVVPILRVPRDIGLLGPELHALDSIDWPEDEVDPDARFWKVLCGLGLFPQGKEEEWGEKARKARGLSGPTFIATSPDEAETCGAQLATRGSAPQVLTCDRDPQWGQLARLTGDSRHEAILVSGPRGEGHRFFLERVVSCLPRDPERRINEVIWGVRRPLAKGTAFEAIAEAVDCVPSRLEATLRTILSRHNLVLVHRPPFEEANCDSLVRYYTKWLPELLGAVDADTPTKFRLKVVQAIRWPAISNLQCGLFQAAKLLGAKSRRLGSLCAKYEAAQRLRQELEQTKGPLAIRFLEPLKPITRQEVEEWSHSLDLDESSRNKLVDDAVEQAEHSVDIFNRIAESLDPKWRAHA